ncbi:MAG: hypothetical protein WC262_07715 [Bacteroidales bacterium]
MKWRSQGETALGLATNHVTAPQKTEDASAVEHPAIGDDRRWVINNLQLLVIVALLTQWLNVLDVAGATLSDRANMIPGQLDVRFATSTCGARVVVHALH